MSEWRAVPGREGLYEVSDDGQVRSLDSLRPRADGSTQFHAGRVLSQCPTPSGYPRVALCRDNRVRLVTVHALVLLAFVGPRPDGMVRCHNDGCKTNNALSNLRYDTPSANVLDEVRHGTHNSASKTHCARGHEYSPENTRIRAGKYAGSTRRDCRACELIYEQTRRRPKTALVT